MVAEVGVSIFGGGIALIQTPPILVLNYVWQRKPELMLCIKFEVATFNGCRNK